MCLILTSIGTIGPSVAMGRAAHALQSGRPHGFEYAPARGQGRRTPRPRSSGTHRSSSRPRRSSSTLSSWPRSRTWSRQRLRASRARADPDAARADGRRLVRVVPGLPRAALVGARPDEGRHPLRRRRRPRRVRRARDVDDLEVRAPAPAVRRREGRRALQRRARCPRRARARHAPLHRRARAVHRAAARHPGARHGDERADDGVDDGHVLDAEGLRRAGDRHGQADLDRRLACSATRRPAPAS